MIVQCPSCKQAIVIQDFGENFCPKCSAKVFIGNPAAQEEDGVIMTPEELRRKAVESLKIKTGDYTVEISSASSGGVLPPWERGEGRWLSRAVNTWRGVSFNPSRFFFNLKTEGMVLKAFLYGWLVMTVGMLASSLYRLAFLPEFLDQLQKNAGTQDMLAGDLELIESLALWSVFLSPVIAAGAILINSALYNLVLRSIGASPKGFGGTLKVVSYASSPMILLVLPFVGGIVAFVWNMALCIMGLTLVQRTTQMRSMLAVVFPPLLFYFLLLMAMQIFGI